MLIARCPHCQTSLRATPDALKVRGGKVRCGQCNKAFNALEHLIDDVPQAAERIRSDGFELMPPANAAPVVAPAAPPTVESAPAGESAAAEPPSKPETADVPDPTAAEPAPEPGLLATPTAPSTEPAPQPGDNTPALEELTEAPAAIEPPTALDPLLEAQQAGLVAAREATEAPGYSKWTEGTFAAGGVAFHEPSKTSWLTIVIALLLGFALLVQLAYIYRTDIAAHWPQSRPWLEEACHSAGCTVAYPANADLIDIQASELQIDPTRGGMLVLYLTLQNKSAHAQAYPSIELTLTDAREQVVVRRLLATQDWLPPKLENPAAFAAQGEVAARLWIDPQDTGAVGYGLKVVYP